jgi:hypothetical protein
MTDRLPNDNPWKTVQFHAAGHVVGAIVFAGLAVGFGLAVGALAVPENKCIALPIELIASL